jgi:acyl carrier protein
MSDSIFEKVRKVVCEELGVQESEVTMEASFVDDLGADSLDVVELVMALEDAFGIDIPDDDVAGLKTVGDVVRYVESKQ